jgi:hypothetical protein
MRRLIFSGLMLLAASCTRNAAPADAPGETAASASVSTEDTDRQAIEKAEAEARVIAKADGCSSSADCRAAPIGARGCGGPRDFILYCAASTDSAALYAKIAAADSLERAFNTKYKVVSTCELRLPPTVEASGGACVAKH